MTIHFGLKGVDGEDSNLEQIYNADDEMSGEIAGETRKNSIAGFGPSSSGEEGMSVESLNAGTFIKVILMQAFIGGNPILVPRF